MSCSDGITAVGLMMVVAGSGWREGQHWNLSMPGRWSCAAAVDCDHWHHLKLTAVVPLTCHVHYTITHTNSELFGVD